MENITKEKLAAAFTEWERQYREDPAGFMSDFEKAQLDTESYGEAAANFLLQLLAK